jgi:hypothetical protein
MREHRLGPEQLLAGPHNSRLGPAIHSFNLPAEPTICVGASPLCEFVCYAHAFHFRLQQARHQRNFERSQQDSFPDAIRGEIRRALIRIVRIHCAGDFYDVAYVRKWARIARACPETGFFAYSRSWRIAEILATLIAFSRLPNVHLWLSEDRDTGRPPVLPGVRRAYLLCQDESEAAVPVDADLVFRVPLPRRPGARNTYTRPAKRLNGVLVCPKEQAIERRVALTCSSCRICFTERRPLSASASARPDLGRSGCLLPSIRPAHPGGPHEETTSRPASAGAVR